MFTARAGAPTEYSRSSPQFCRGDYQLECLDTLTCIFWSNLWTIWGDFLATANHRRSGPSQRFWNRDAIGASIYRRGVCDGSDRTVVGLERRTALALYYFRDDGSGWIDSRGDDSIAASVAGRDLDCRRGHLGNVWTFLGDRVGMFHQRVSRGRYRAHQLSGKPGRIRRSVYCWDGEAGESQLRGRNARDGGLGAGRGSFRVDIALAIA